MEPQESNKKSPQLPTLLNRSPSKLQFQSVVISSSLSWLCMMFSGSISNKLPGSGLHHRATSLSALSDLSPTSTPAKDMGCHHASWPPPTQKVGLNNHRQHNFYEASHPIIPGIDGFTVVALITARSNFPHVKFTQQLCTY